MAAPLAKRVCRGDLNDLRTELYEASINGDTALINNLLQELSSSERDSILKPAEVNSSDDIAFHMFEEATGYGNLNVMSCLVENGADVNVRSKSCQRTPLMSASEFDELDAVKFLVEHGARVDLQDRRGETCLHHAASQGSVASHELLRYLLDRGADINALTNDKDTPLILAAKNVEYVAFGFLEHGANVFLKNNHGETALHTACQSANASCCLLSCLIEKGVNINSCTSDNCTPLMLASKTGDAKKVTFLIEHGANVHVEDQNGDTALHYATRSRHDSFEVVVALIAAGASQMCNNQGLTPLLEASKHRKPAIVEELIKSPDVTKEQRIDSLELLGASLILQRHCSSETTDKAFSYLRRGMEERFADSLHPLLKQPMEPIDDYQNRQESQSLEELLEIVEDRSALIVESLIIMERVLGKENANLPDALRSTAKYFFDNNNSMCIRMSIHRVKVSQWLNQSAFSERDTLYCSFKSHAEFWGDDKNQAFVVELLELIVSEIDNELLRGTAKSLPRTLWGCDLFDCTFQVISLLCKIEVANTSKVSVLLQRLCGLNPKDVWGNTILHYFLKKKFYTNETDAFVLIDVVKILLSSEFNVNVTNNRGDTPLHIVATMKPSNDVIPMFTNLLEILLDEGAHQDFVNHDGKTAMDLAETYEAYSILWKRRKLELKCISARAVKKFGLPYVGVVPKILENYISMH